MLLKNLPSILFLIEFCSARRACQWSASTNSWMQKSWIQTMCNMMNPKVSISQISLTINNVTIIFEQKILFWSKTGHSRGAARQVCLRTSTFKWKRANAWRLSERLEAAKAPYCQPCLVKWTKYLAVWIHPAKLPTFLNKLGSKMQRFRTTSSSDGRWIAKSMTKWLTRVLLSRTLRFFRVAIKLKSEKKESTCREDRSRECRSPGLFTTMPKFTFWTTRFQPSIRMLANTYLNKS